MLAAASTRASRYSSKSSSEAARTRRDDAGKDIIDSLHADCSEALNGFWEARYMRGLLGEFLRYAANLPKSAKPSSKTLENQGKPFTLEVVKEG